MQFLLLIWIITLFSGSWLVTAYQFQSDFVDQDAHARYWPTQSAIVPAKHSSTLLLFLHPKCPCSRASLTQIERLLADVQASGSALPRTYVVGTLPENGFDDWADSENLRRAAKLPRASNIIDRGGREAALFGATTSGFVMLFDDTLNGRYAGGITPARGLEGANAGCDTLLALLNGNEPNIPNIPAFGCRLCLPDALQGSSECSIACPVNTNPKSANLED